MANYELLKQGLVAVIKENGNQEITGQLLQQQLLAIINSLGAGYLLIGAATTTTNPGTPDQNVAYLAIGPGTYTNFGGLVVTDPLVLLKWNGQWSQETLSTGIKALFAAVISDIDDINDAIVAINATILSLQNNKADKNGWYNGLVAGAAENLIGQMPASAFFTYRQTDDGKAGTGAAQIQTIKGRTLAWNQLVHPTNFSTIYLSDNSGLFKNNGDGTYTITTTGTTANTLVTGVQVSVTVGHKILIKFGNTAGGYITMRYNGSLNIGQDAIFTATSAGIYPRIATGLAAGTYETSFNIIDLTAMFGAGNEPSTVAEFDALYSELYYANNTGTLLPYKGTGLKTTGVNKWDEQFEVGYSINATTGAKEPNASTSIAKNFIKVTPSTTYYMINGSWANRRIAFYRKDKSFISLYQAENNGSFVTPSDCYFILFYWLGTTYNNDICINLSNTSINGQYFPYEEYTISLPVVGKTATDGNGNAIVPFPDGMHGTPTIYDTATKVGGSKVMGIVNLGGLNWTKQTTGSGTGGGETPFFRTTISDMKRSTMQVVCQSYIYANSGDKRMNTVEWSSARQLNIWDSAFYNSTAAEFKAAMAGVYLVYELETPVPFTWDEPLPMNYPVNRLGTEMLEPAGVDENGVPQTAPLTAEIIYPIDAIGTLLGLPQDYISQGSDINQLEAMKSAGLITAYTRTFNATTGKYEYTFTV